jgi:flagellar operon protein
MVNQASTIGGIRNTSGSAGTSSAIKPGGDFASALSKATEKQDQLKISSHAQKRLDSSKVVLSDSDMQRIGGAIQKASDKGSKQSLVMLDDLALVVSVKNKVVITAVDEARRQEGVFTNIDSVVMA